MRANDPSHVGDSALYRKIGYVGLSRAKHRAELHRRADVLDAAKRALRQSRAQRAAHELSRQATAESEAEIFTSLFNDPSRYIVGTSS